MPAAHPPEFRRRALDLVAQGNPAGHNDRAHYRVRHDHVDTNGKISFRRAARMHHLGVGANHRGTPVILIAESPVSLWLADRGLAGRVGAGAPSRS